VEQALEMSIVQQIVQLLGGDIDVKEPGQCWHCGYGHVHSGTSIKAIKAMDSNDQPELPWCFSFVNTVLAERSA